MQEKYQFIGGSSQKKATTEKDVTVYFATALSLKGTLLLIS